MLVTSLLATLALAAGPVPPDPADFAARPITRIAFGSCAKQDAPQPIWDQVHAWRPDVFVMLGDNVYGDTEDMRVLREKYAALGAKPEFRRVAETTPMLATWDDHDYGANDAGREYPMKEASKTIMLDFFGEPSGSERRSREGIYDAAVYGPEGRRVQIILLDLRTFRTPLARRERTAEEEDREVGPYVPRTGDDVTMLGDAQWAWLETQLRKPAELRVIAMSTQFLVEFNGWEAWANMPAERERLLGLITSTRAEGVLFISGDTHWAELSLVERDGLYPLLDLTSSGLTEVWRRDAPNRNRIVGSYLGANFGEIEIDWSDPDPAISLRIVGVDGRRHLSHTRRRSALTFAAAEDAGPKAGVAGEWSSTFGTMTLTGDDGAVHGRYGDDHRIEGRISGRVIEGTWSRKDGATGPVRFRLTRCGRYLQGSWGHADDRRAADGGLPFSWRATRRVWD